jgi:hypothetical protein
MNAFEGGETLTVVSLVVAVLCPVIVLIQSPAAMQTNPFAGVSDRIQSNCLPVYPDKHSADLAHSSSQ